MVDRMRRMALLLLRTRCSSCWCGVSLLSSLLRGVGVGGCAAACSHWLLPLLTLLLPVACCRAVRTLVAATLLLPVAAAAAATTQ